MRTDTPDDDFNVAIVVFMVIAAIFVAVVTR